MLVLLALHAASLQLSIVAGSGGSSNNNVIATVAVFNSASQNKNIPCFFLQLRMGWENDGNQCLEMSWLRTPPVEAEEGGGY